ncbi:MAG: hypothetical protein NT010_10505 [Proteobacteria bacterium]|nr:hypothetical protein [Pseudomonadota bacterium]
MKRVLLIAAVLFIGFTFITTALALDKTTATTDKKAKIDIPARTKKAAGEVIRVDIAENIIVINGKKCEETFDIKDVKWKVYKNAEEVRASDFVVIAFRDMDGKKIAKKIIKSKKPGEKKAVLKKNEVKPAPDKPTVK